MKKPADIVEDGRVWWFGESWGAPICDEDYHVETPVGQKCLSSGKTINEDDRGFVMVSGNEDETFDRKPVLFDEFMKMIGVNHGIRRSFVEEN